MENYVTLCREISQLHLFRCEVSTFRLKGKPVQVRRGPATVLGSFIDKCHCPKDGKAYKMSN